MSQPERLRDESHYRTIFERAGSAISVLDLSGAMEECNLEMSALFGYSREELQLMNLRDLVHPDDFSACWAAFQQVVDGHRISSRMEKRFRRRDGQELWCVLKLSSVPGENGSPGYVIGILKNNTERKQAEEELQASREHLEASVKASNTGLWDWNLITNEVYYSPEWKSQLGFQEHEISTNLGEWQNRLHPEDRQRALVMILAFIHNPGPSFEMEFRLRHKDGTYRWILTRASALRDSNGRVYRMLGCHLDITERKQAEDRLREYEKVVEGLQEMIVVVGRDYSYLIANRAFLHYREMELQQVVGHPVSEILDEEFFRSTIKPRLDECFRGSIVRYEVKYNYPKLGPRNISICYLPIEGPMGIDRVACVLDDITERKRAEEELRRAHERLTAELEERTRAEQRVRALSDRVITAQEVERKSIARELHDDLNQEIAALGISISKLKRDIPEQDTALREQTDAIHQRTVRLAERIRQLARQLHPAALEYSGIAAALQAYGAEFGALNGINISVEAHGNFDDVPAPVGLCLYRVAQEALQNVVKHSKSATALVRIERRSTFILLVIKDWGLGFQGTRAGTDRGLGLVSMSERVRLVNGTLIIETAPGAGTTVTASVPL